jgi:hypothetical protein
MGKFWVKQEFQEWCMGVVRAEERSGATVEE